MMLGRMYYETIISGINTGDSQIEIGENAGKAMSFPAFQTSLYFLNLAAPRPRSTTCLPGGERAGSAFY